MEQILLNTGTTVKGVVEEQGFDGVFWRGNYKDAEGVNHFVTWHNNMWMERC